jgi:hypothetical protein
MCWITVGPPDQPGTSIVLEPPAATPGITDDERGTIVELAGHSDRDDAERDGKRASLLMVGATTTSGLARELGSRDGSSVIVPGGQAPGTRSAHGGVSQ